jgi:penicillin-insensitive murein DD-endopeptidase
MRNFLIVLLAISFVVLVAFTNNKPVASTEPKTPTELYYERNKGDSLPSICTGTEAGGTLTHAKLIPFSGTNYRYFDAESYLQGHAFMSDKMANTLLASYKELEALAPGRIFSYMESGLQNGGPIPGHRTHQNGRSVDLMVPLMKDSVPYYSLDSIGGWHYTLDFDDKGRYSRDSTVAIDFNLLAMQVLSLDRQARKNGLHVKKVILKLELKDDFYSTPQGKKVKSKGIYLAMNLPPATNKQHDDHFHVDFEPLAPSK